MFRIDNFHSLNEVVALMLHHQPLECDEYDIEILGSCNGLLVLSNMEEDTVVWTPSTRKYAKVPFTEIVFPKHCFGCQYIVYGFGYDAVKEFDYKLVRIVQLYGDVGDNEIRVFSLKNRCWKKGESFSHGFKYKPGNGVFVGNALHWIAFRDIGSDVRGVIVCFDMGSEKFGEVSLPVIDDGDVHMYVDVLRGCLEVSLALIDDGDVHMNVDVLRGCLVLLCNYMSTRVDIWVMEDYRVKESWVKLIVVTNKIIRHFKYIKTLAYSRFGNKVLLDQDGKKFIWFNLKTKQVRKLRFGGPPKHYDTRVCVNSLVPLDGDGASGSNENNTEGKRKQA